MLRRIQIRSWVVPTAMFVIAVAVATLAGPASLAVALRPPGGSTMDCRHEAGLNETPPLCVGEMTGPAGDLIPSPCDSEDSAPDWPGLSKEVLQFRQIHGQDALAGRTLRVLRSARDDGRLHGVEEQSETLDFIVINATEAQCDPCHDLTAFVLARAAVNINLDKPVNPGDLCEGSADARIRAERKSDCKKLAPAKLSEDFRASFFRQVTPAGEFEQEWEEDINGNVTTYPEAQGSGNPSIGVIVKTVSLPSGFMANGFEPASLNYKAKLKYKATVRAFTTRAATGPDQTARTRPTVQLLVGDLTCETEGVGNRVQAGP